MKKLSGDIALKLSWFTLQELQDLLLKLKDSYKNDRFSTLKHVINFYNDSDILSYLNKDPEIKKDPEDTLRKLEDIRNCYKKTEDSNGIGIIEKVVNKRGRKKSFKKTLKEKIFELLDDKMLDYNGVLLAGVVDVSENSFKTILSQYRTVKGINVKRGRKPK